MNGNQIRKTVKATGDTWRYSYTIFDELSTAARYDTPAPDATATLIRDYRYDALGRRLISDDRNARNDTHYLYDGQHIIMSFRKVSLSDSVDVRFFTHSDITDDVLAVTGQGSASNPFFSNGFAPSDASSYYHSDHQGSVRALTDDTGAIINEYSYGAYGDTETEVEALAQPFRYTSREYDPDTGLMHYRARTYDPVAGRFLQEAPLWFGAGDLNVHRYVWNNPVNWVDPSGESASGYAGTARIGSMLGAGRTFAGPLSREMAISLLKKGAAPLAAVGAIVACKYFQIADMVAGAWPGADLVKSTCGATSASGINDDTDNKPTLLPPPYVPQRGLCSCRCGVVAGRDVSPKPKPRFALWSAKDRPNCRATAVQACRIAKTRLNVTSVHHQQAVCRFDNGPKFTVFN